MTRIRSRAESVPAPKAGAPAGTAKSRASGSVVAPRASGARASARSAPSGARAGSAPTDGVAVASRPRATTRVPNAVERPEPAVAPAPMSNLGEAEGLWMRYVDLRSNPAADQSERESVRNSLIENYYTIVKFTAERMRMRLPSEVETDDLMSAGLFGLMDAIDAFEPSRGVKFETYCAQRVRGAIFDELRAMDWVPRLVRSRTAKIEKVRKSIEMETGRKASDDEVAKRLNVPSDEFEKLKRDSRPVGVVSLNKKWGSTDSGKEGREIDIVEDGRETDPFQKLSRNDLQSLLTKGLSRSERLIVILYYYEELTMKEIGMTLDLSESRVSQMHSSILARLKAQIQHRLKEL